MKVFNCAATVPGASYPSERFCVVAASFVDAVTKAAKVTARLARRYSNRQLGLSSVEQVSERLLGFNSKPTTRNSKPKGARSA
jgi:hypothetical protein